MFESVIQEQADFKKNAPAYIDVAGSITYSEMARDIGCCSRWMQSRGVKRGDRVILRLSSFYYQWVFFFALEGCEAVSVLMSTSRSWCDADVVSLRADRYVTDIATDESPSIRGDFLDRGWLARVRKFRPIISTLSHRSGDDPICILLSSGTTGKEKKVILTRKVIDTRAITDRSSELINARSRLLLLYPQDSIGSVVSTISILSVGATICIKQEGFSSTETLERIQPTMIMGAPSHYGKLLGELREGFVPVRAIDASTGGGVIPASVVALMRKNLGGKIKISYASTETGLVARGDILVAEEHKGAVGFVLPSVEVSVRSEVGLPLPFGEVGEIWVRSPHVVSSYLEDPEQTAWNFRDGWFRPGDVGSLQEDGLLVIAGRTDDLMNYRGIKIMPSDLERSISSAEWCEDCIAFMADDPRKIEPRIWIVCVPSGDVEIEDVRKAVPADVPFSLALLDNIPRNEMGKADRALLRRQAESGQLGVRKTVRNAADDVQDRNM